MKGKTPIDPELYEQFLTLFTRDQLRIMGWIRALVPNHTSAADVFQETSLELWRSFPTFRPDSDFLPWALGVARYQVLKHWRKTKRDRLTFSEEFLDELTVEAIGMAEELTPRQAALEECVSQLSDRQRDLIHRFYGDNQTAAVIANAWERSVHAVYKSLKVMRAALLECVEAKLLRQTP